MDDQRGSGFAVRSRQVRPERRLAAVAVAGAIGLAALVGVVAPVGAGVVSDHGYGCSSELGSSDTVWSYEVEAPTQVSPGETFEATVVLTGTTEIDLLLESMDVALGTPDGADPTGPLHELLAGPGATDPPGPFAPAGSTNSTSPMVFSLAVTAPVGGTVTLWPSTVTSVAEEIGEPANHLTVTCEPTDQVPLVTIPVVADVDPFSSSSSATTSTSTIVQNPTPTPAPPAPTPARGAVLGISQTPAATPVAAVPAMTG